MNEFQEDERGDLVHKNVHDNQDKERQDAGHGKEERRTDEEGRDAAALRGRRGNPEGHDEGVGEGLEEFHGAPISIVGGFLRSSRGGDSDGTKVTLPMGSTNGARLGVL